MRPDHHDADARAGGAAPMRPIAREIEGRARIRTDQGSGVPAAPGAWPPTEAGLVERRAAEPTAAIRIMTVGRIGPVDDGVMRRVTEGVLTAAVRVGTKRRSVADAVIVPITGMRRVVAAMGRVSRGRHHGECQRGSAEKSYHQ